MPKLVCRHFNKLENNIGTSVSSGIWSRTKIWVLLNFLVPNLQNQQMLAHLRRLFVLHYILFFNSLFNTSLLLRRFSLLPHTCYLSVSLLLLHRYCFHRLKSWLFFNSIIIAGKYARLHPRSLLNWWEFASLSNKYDKNSANKSTTNSKELCFHLQYYYTLVRYYVE